MKIILKLEHLTVLLASIYFFSQSDFTWWWYLVLFLAPDLGMIGYTINTKWGAITYNILHHYGVAALVFCLGKFLEIGWLELAGIVMIGHIAFDRLLGYGLKFSDDFRHTHLGWIGNNKP